MSRTDYPSQEAAPRPVQLRKSAAALPESSGQARDVNGTGHGWAPGLEAPQVQGKQHLMPTARQRELWEKVQQAKRRGPSLGAMARELGVR